MVDYRLNDNTDRINSMESGLTEFSTTFGYDNDGNIISQTYTNNESEVVLIEYTYDSAGDISSVTGKLDTVLQYTKTFTYDSEGNITNTVIV